MSESESFVCPECHKVTHVVWDPGQESREIDCIHCRRDNHTPVPVKDPQGGVLFSKSWKDAEGKPVPVTVCEIHQVGCRYKIERGKGVK